jgi:LysR family glycine cleavage system transcriptional activator
MKRRLPPLNSIRAFEAAGRLLSVSDAAEELSVTPTAISHQIRQLEDFLGLKLFERAGRRIQLTDQGVRILPDVTKGMDQIADAFEDVFKSGDHNTINISVTREFARYWLQPRLGNFYKLYPDFTLNIFSSEQCVDLDSSEFDLAIRYGPKPDENSGEILLFQEHYAAVTSKHMIAEMRLPNLIENIHPKRLIDVRWEKSDLDAPTWKKWFEVNEIDNFKSYNRMMFDAYNLAFDALKRGYGAALISQTIVNSDEFSDDLICLDGSDLEGCYYRIINTASGKKKKAVKQFVDWLLNPE